MSTFILRILFSGLISFVPNQDGTELTVLLVNVDHTYHTSDGTHLDHHKPLLLARGGGCTGTCPTDDDAIARFIYPDQAQSARLDSLATAVSGGGAWLLDNSKLTLQKGSTNDPNLPALSIVRNARGSTNNVLDLIPTTSAEREDYSWVADLKSICSSCDLKSAVHDAEPPAGLVAARFKLRNGRVFTYSVARIGSDVTPVQFKRLNGQGSVSPYSQAVATWVAADIEVSGDSIEMIDQKFDGSSSRSMTLTPDENGRVEMAVLNLPTFAPPPAARVSAPGIGKHFERYYDLVDTPPSSGDRLVPWAGAAPNTPSYPQVAWDDIHPTEELWSELLNQLRLNIGRTTYDRTICPPFNGTP
ncbi:MAG TPA: hypothetical protein VGR02_00395 [Thermoanaerobaculia bacterium]|jgi:hypothetical protein|nr:hypothetical protein [Thermoanaerobaculia bacterium]